MKKSIFAYVIIIVLGMSILTTSISGEYITIEKSRDISKTSLDNEKISTLPSSFDWRNVNGVDFTTPVKNQGPFGSCETFALVGVLETMVQIKVGFPFNCDLSEAHLYFWSNGNLDWGSYIENDTDFLVNYGVPDEACWPYPKDRQLYPKNTTSLDWKDRTVKIENWSYLPDDPQVIKWYIVNNGPVPAYFTIYDDWIYHKKGVYYHRWGDTYGPHYIGIYGYNDEEGYWICKGSWGTNYQENGWFRIGYGECDIGKKSFLLQNPYGKFPILYVDDDNTAGPWDGTKEFPYNKIQDAINNSFPGYCVYVKNGTYCENLVINKTIYLKGENKESTILDGNNFKHVIVASEPYIKISGFTIQNSGSSYFDTGVMTLCLDANITIEGNIIKNCDIGIYLNDNYYQTISTIKDNLIYNNRKGIYSQWSYNNIIENNTIKNNKEFGIDILSSKNGFIINNKIENNLGYGLRMSGASNKNLVKENEIKGNKIGIFLNESNRNKIIRNNFIDNENQASFDNCLLTCWNRNYWSDWQHILPKTIKGMIGVNQFPWINHDFLPKKTPYNII